jgi:hypothetical protein
MPLIMLLAMASFLLFAVFAVVAVALVLVLRRPGPRSYDLAHRPTFSTPLERVQAAASELTAAEREEFRRWVTGRQAPPPPPSEGITR